MTNAPSPNGDNGRATAGRFAKGNSGGPGNRPMTTELQNEANRRNAQLSTGPRSADGKALARVNSTKHGLCANPAAGVIEDPAAFEQLQGDLVARIAPTNPIEAGLIHRIAVCLWRLQRAAKIDAAVSGMSVTAAAPLRDRVQLWVSRINSMFLCEYKEEKDPAKRPRGLPKDQKWFVFTRPWLKRLDEMRNAFDGEIRKDGAAIEAMSVMLQSSTRRLSDPRCCYSFTQMEAQVMAWLLGESAERYAPDGIDPTLVGGENHRGNGLFYPDERPWRSPIDELIGQARKLEYPKEDSLPADLAALIERRHATFHAWMLACDDPITKTQVANSRTACLLPSSETLDRLIRYESHADRTLAKSLETLARLRGATVEKIMAKVTLTSPDGQTVQEVQGERTTWSFGATQ